MQLTCTLSAPLHLALPHSPLGPQAPGSVHGPERLFLCGGAVRRSPCTSHCTGGHTLPTPEAARRVWGARPWKSNQSQEKKPGVKAENLKGRQEHKEEPALAGKKPGTRRRTVTCRHAPCASRDAHTGKAWKPRDKWNCWPLEHHSPPHPCGVHFKTPAEAWNPTVLHPVYCFFPYV